MPLSGGFLFLLDGRRAGDRARSHEQRLDGGEEGGKALILLGVEEGNTALQPRGNDLGQPEGIG